jgi:hypothetical protein
VNDSWLKPAGVKKTNDKLSTLQFCVKGNLMRTFDVMLIGTVLISLLFLGSVFLLIDIPIFNRVDPLTLELAYLGLCLGLVFGLFSGVWYTKSN